MYLVVDGLEGVLQPLVGIFGDGAVRSVDSELEGFLVVVHLRGRVQDVTVLETVQVQPELFEKQLDVVVRRLVCGTQLVQGQVSGTGDGL